MLSAHRQPEETADYCANARMRGLKVIIAGAGMSAALPGFAASKSDLPVIGVPHLGQEPGRPRRAALRRADAARRARRLRGDRRRQERRVAGGPDHQRLSTQRRPSPSDRQNHYVIPRYTREEIGAVWTQQRRMEAWLEVELAATDAWAAEGVVPKEAAAACRERASFTVEAVEGARADHRPRRRRLRRRRLASRSARRAAGCTTGSPPRTSSTPRSALQLREAGEIVIAGARGLPRRAGREGARARRDALRRAHPRGPRRADHLRAEARRLRLRGRPQPATGSRDAFEQARGRQALGRGRHLRLGPAGGRGAGDGGARPAAARTSRPRSCRATATRWSWPRGSRSPAAGWSASRPRSATCSGPRSARSRSRSARARRAPRRCPTSATRSSPSGSPGSPGSCAATPRSGWRTSPSGTSATSPTPAPSG